MKRPIYTSSPAVGKEMHLVRRIVLNDVQGHENIALFPIKFRIGSLIYISTFHCLVPFVYCDEIPPFPISNT